MTDAILEARDVGRVFGSGARAFAAVDGVDFTLHAGETLGVVGTSGSGKSTLGELAGGLQKPTRGTVLFRGADVAKLDRLQRRVFRRAVQFVFQDAAASMDPRYTVERVLTEPMTLLDRGTARSERRGRARAMAERVGLDADVLTARPGELSGGQAQRVAIARALMASPQAVVCDECTSALDVSVQAQTLNLLRDLQDELGVAYLFISHDRGVVDYMAHRVIAMSHGRVVARGRCCADLRPCDGAGV